EGVQRLEVSVLGRREEARGQLLALLVGRVEAGSPLLYVTPRPGGELAGVLLARADDLGHLAVAVVEDVVEEERRPLLGGERLEQDQERQRQRVGLLRLSRRILLGGGQRLRPPLADAPLPPRSGRAHPIHP